MICLFIQNDVLRRSLALLLKRFEDEHEVVIAALDDDINADQASMIITDKDITASMPCSIIDIRTMSYPIKPSFILSKVSAVLHRDDDHRHIKELTLGPYVFRPHDFSLLSLDNTAVTLTEKERDILLYIDRNSPVSRDDLLHGVWGYGDNIETHTVETHIYRLRQKIEKDPSNPKLLITTDEGYCLCS